MQIQKVNSTNQTSFNANLARINRTKFIDSTQIVNIAPASRHLPNVTQIKYLDYGSGKQEVETMNLVGKPFERWLYEIQNAKNGIDGILDLFSFRAK